MKRYLFGKYVLDLPDDHSFQVIHQKDVLYDRLYGSIIAQACAAQPRGVVVDIGANVGDTAANIATVASNPILSVEGSDKYFEYLRCNAHVIGHQVSILNRFVMPTALQGTPLRFVPRDGSGYLTAATASETDTIDYNKTISVRDLLRFSRTLGDGLAFIKSDTDGCDAFIVEELLSEEQPTPLFFECDTLELTAGLPSPWPRVFLHLEQRDYGIIVFDNAGLPICATRNGVANLLRDLSGYIYLQRCVGMVKIYYLDIWAFPPSSDSLFQSVVEELRSRLLRPYGG